ncbi:hypothetical protein [Spiroplasma cantharicola]|uniref:Uncharacterized protein n=1 Tax=Spiroplasma cantharicola TaxID=362837 RepID=A0A0M4JS12_9MOLU|nr:hypothetical protein [Spiroplasma cantharicola]ALD66071.1 hypothetical protein SCANT_v1c01610 [Spiroplasma cantharicola]
MRKKESNIKKFVDRIFNKNNKANFKRVFLLGSIFGFVSSITLAISLPIVLKSKLEQQIYFKFDNNYFSSKEEIYEYSKLNAINNNYSFQSNIYMFDDEIFNTKDELDLYIENKFQLNEIKTKRNPNDYLINNSGELSGLVKTSSNESIQTVYKGNNDLTYLSKNDALETYTNNFQLNYEIDGQHYDNIFSAREHYLNVKLKNLESSESKTMCYEQGGMCQTQEQITSWLRNNISKGFEYQGKDFSNLNYLEFLDAMKDLDEEIINRNIQPVLNADKSSYWVTQHSKKSLSYFVGPKYFESNENVSSIAEFKPIKSYDINALMLPIWGWAFAIITTVVLDSKIKDPIGSDYEMMNYLNNTFETLNLNKEFLNVFNRDFYSIISKNLKDDLSYGLAEIEDNDLSDFYRLLISFKRFLDLTKIYDLSIKPEELEKNLKQIVVEILNSQKDFMNNFIDVKDNKEGANILLDDSISFDDIYSLFLNTSNFFNDGGTKKILWDIAEKIFRGVDAVMEKIDKISGAVKQVSENIKDSEKTKNKNESELEKNMQKNKEMITNSLVNNEKEFINAMGLDIEESNLRFSPLLIVYIAQAVSGVWNLGQMFSFISLKTYEAKLDSNQSLYYFKPTFKLPLLNISFGKVKDQSIYTLNDAPLKYFSPSIDGKEIKELYEFDGKYYKEKNKAIDDLKYSIYKKPENYLKTKQLLTSVISKDNNYMLNLPSICNSNSSTQGCLQSYEYEKKLAEEKEKYISNLFNKFYKDNGKEYYLDGFGGGYESKQIAIQELQRKADDSSNYKEIYTYEMNNNKVFKETKKEIQEFIRNNQIIEYKSIINTDLIETSYYYNLKENNGYDFKIYEMNFYGQKKYFRSYLEAINYLDNKINYQVYELDRKQTTYTYKGIEFLDEKNFKQWIDKQIEIVFEKNNIDGRGSEQNAKTYFNSLCYN